ncbi:gamma-glutamyltransferase [Comamonas sp. 4034]|uniref:gamma-glutamyltransferase n=1 Tax=Comamonas sp. 4034 TaxID=3156455 RepID=UPI003D1F53E4
MQIPSHPASSVSPRYSLVALGSIVLLSLAGCGSSGGNDDKLVSTACEASTNDGSVVVGSGLPGDPSFPELASGYRTGKKAVEGNKYMVVTANPLASKAGCEVLKSGGSAVDAAVAVQMVLGLVEPQSSGIGGGAFMLYYDAASKKVTAYDGRETAPAAATPDYLRYISDADKTVPQPSARASGRAVGTPGAVRMLDLAHKDHGSKPWKDLIQPGIDLATNGFKISGRMSDALAGAKTALQADADAIALYFNADGSTKSLGQTFTNPAYAATLTKIATGGADAFYTGAVAQGIVNKIGVTQNVTTGTPITPGVTTMADLAGYQAKKRDAVCTTYRAKYVICGMPPPSSGGIAVAQAMGVLENFDLAPHKPTALDLEGGKPTAMGVHLVSEAERLAYADRDVYVADTDFTPLPGPVGSTLLDKNYLKSRAALISTKQSMGTATAGQFGNTRMGVSKVAENGTTHMTIVDAKGNVVSMTTTVEAGMGSYHITQGFVLNNQLTDFSATPTSADGLPIANKLEAGKRPRSSMAPTLVFDANADGTPGAFKMATGSPGGSTIIQFVTKTLVGALDWGLDAQQATNLVNFGAANSKTTNLGGEHPNIVAANNGDADPLVQALRAMGHTVSVNAQSSGVGTVIRTASSAGEARLTGGADPRREGVVLGDTYKVKP